MIRNITVDGEEGLAVDTAEELGRALLTGRYVVASDAVRAEYGLTDTANSDTQDIVDESDWRDDAWRAEGGTDGVGPNAHHGAETRVEPGRLPHRVCLENQRADRAGRRAVAETVSTRARQRESSNNVPYSHNYLIYRYLRQFILA